MNKFKIGDIVKFTADRGRRNDYIADLEADWSDHDLTEGEYSTRVRILERCPCVVVEIEESQTILLGLVPVNDPKPHKAYLIDEEDVSIHEEGQA